VSGLRHLALLRGVNVGTAKRIGMPALREAFVAAGYDDARTVLQSGNVVFTASRVMSAAAVERLEAAVHDRTGVHSRIVVLAAPVVRRVVDENPLLEMMSDASRMLVALPRAGFDPRGVRQPAAREIAPDVLSVSANAVYHWAPNGQTESRVPETYWRAFGDTITRRNWRTLTRLLELLEA